MGHSRKRKAPKEESKVHRKNRERERKEEREPGEEKKEREAIFGNFKYKNPECTRINSGSTDLILLLCVPFILLLIQI